MISSVKDFLMTYASCASPMIQRSDLEDECESDVIKHLIDNGYLVSTGEMGRSIRVYGLTMQIEEIRTCRPHQFFYWDAGELVTVESAQLEIFRIDYSPLATLIRHDIAAFNDYREIIPGGLWLCGQFGRQRRNIFMTRNAGTNADVTKYLRGDEGKPGDMVLQLGIVDSTISEKFMANKVRNLAELLDGAGVQLNLDRNTIQACIDDKPIEKEDTKKQYGEKFLRVKRKTEDALVDRFSLELENKRRACRGESPIPRLPSGRRKRGTTRIEDDYYDQKTLAKAMETSETMISRIISEWRADVKDRNASTLYLDLLGLYFRKTPLDSDTIFEFHDSRKKELHEAGLVE